MLRIVVDEREKPSGVPEQLSALGALVDYRVLEVGDYIVRDYAIERKFAPPLVRSLYTRRLFHYGGTREMPMKWVRVPLGPEGFLGQAWPF